MKAKLIGAQKGYDLLKKKSDALKAKMNTLLKVIREVSFLIKQRLSVTIASVQHARAVSMLRRSTRWALR